MEDFIQYSFPSCKICRLWLEDVCQGSSPHATCLPPTYPVREETTLVQFCPSTNLLLALPGVENPVWEETTLVQFCPNTNLLLASPGC